MLNYLTSRFLGHNLDYALQQPKTTAMEWQRKTESTELPALRVEDD